MGLCKGVTNICVPKGVRVGLMSAKQWEKGRREVGLPRGNDLSAAVFVLHRDCSPPPPWLGTGGLFSLSFPIGGSGCCSPSPLPPAGQGSRSSILLPLPPSRQWGFSPPPLPFLQPGTGNGNQQQPVMRQWLKEHVISGGMGSLTSLLPS